MTSLKIFNAPAGSGKSTEIKARVREWAAAFPNDHLLCVTFTNRAAEELKDGISVENVDVSTIHSFLGGFMKSVFVTPEAVDLYLNLYRAEIEARIANVENKPNIEESNARYREKLGEPLTYELVASSITHLYYNETQFDSVLSGGLSHERLLSFANECSERFPGLPKRIGSRYQQIIIDEYQDTSVETLELFVSAARNGGASLHLYGDPMQQIYQSTSSRLRSVLECFEIESRTVTNYRSSSAIVEALNAIYNDPAVIQEPHDESNSEKPSIHMTADTDGLRAEIETEGTLVLSVRNASIFHHIGATSLFESIKRLPEHAHGSRYPALSVLTEPRWIEVKNPLVQLLYGLLFIEDRKRSGEVGVVIQTLRRYPSVFGIHPVANHDDKARLANELQELFEFLASDTVLIKEVLQFLMEHGDLSADAGSVYLESEDYAAVLEVPFAQVRRMYKFNLRPGWSTQHGVKGEGHERVIFLAEDAPYPVSVQMNALLNLWVDVPFSLEQIESAYVRIDSLFSEARQAAEGYYSAPSKRTYDLYAEIVSSQARSVVDACRGDVIFNALYGDKFDTYFTKLHTTSAKDLFKIAALEGLLTAYRLFYVGCSRACKKLDVIVGIQNVEDVEAFGKKFEELGFNVVVHS